MKIWNVSINAVSIVDKQGRQRIRMKCQTSRAMHVLLHVYRGDEVIVENHPFALSGGKAEAVFMLPAAKADMDTQWKITDKKGNVLYETSVYWKAPKELTLYVMTSSHTDIGLHNSQYYQKYYSSVFADKAMELCDETADRPEEDQYRYVIEGTWFFENYMTDRTPEQAQRLIDDYIKTGKMGVCCCVAGNHTQMYGLEELCMSTYEKSKLEEKYGVVSKTMSMIDNNGISQSIISPYAEAGIENIIFCPNQWNPLPSTIWKQDHRVGHYTWNPMAQGSGARIDIRYDSDLPMLFFWQDPETEKKILVWGSTQYGTGGEFWGISHRDDPHDWNWHRTDEMADAMTDNLPLFEEKYPYDTWMFASYDDDLEPNLYLADTIQQWNAKYDWPKFRLMGNPDEPFERIREKYADQIPVLSGDITGGWYQHPVTTPELIAKKFELDRLLPTAEKLSTLACLADSEYAYPETDFRRAWDYLLFHDEHSYGTSGYQGKRVYETWMQHNDWLNKVKATSEKEIDRALTALAGNIPADEESTVVFNPASVERREYFINKEGNYAEVQVPAMGYTVIPEKDFRAFAYETEKNDCPPVIENQYYKISFSENGGIRSIIDKEQNRELLDLHASYAANEPIYTKDNHKTFAVPEKAEFTVKISPERIVVTAVNKDSIAGADIIRTVTLDCLEKRIDIDNELLHAREFYNNCRYHRYLYFAFPFDVPDAKRYCHLNGSMAEYAVSVTGHGTDVYMAVNEWCCAENADLGVALINPDSTLVEYDHIHTDKTDFGDVGEGSGIYSYVSNDWLQMHAYGTDYFNFRFRYSIVSYGGSYAQAGIPETAEKICTPVQSVQIGKQKGTWNGQSASLLETDSDMRLVGFKRAKDGNGVIARFYGAWDAPVLKSSLIDQDGDAMEILNINETAAYVPAEGEKGFFTCKVGKGKIHLPVCGPEVKEDDEVGTVYTGLMTEPMAARGEHVGHLYLLWGHAAAEDIVCYRLYRGDAEDFVCDEQSFVADVDPGKFCVISYEDRGLEEYRPYYYRVCAVHADGRCGKPSKVFCGITKETLE